MELEYSYGLVGYRSLLTPLLFNVKLKYVIGFISTKSFRVGPDPAFFLKYSNILNRFSKLKINSRVIRESKTVDDNRFPIRLEAIGGIVGRDHELLYFFFFKVLNYIATRRDAILACG